MCVPHRGGKGFERLARLGKEGNEHKEQHECPEDPGDREEAGAAAWDEAHTAQIGSGGPPLDPA